MVTGATRGEGRNRTALSVDLKEGSTAGGGGLPGPPPSPAGTRKQKPWPCLLSICNLVLAPRSTNAVSQHPNKNSVCDAKKRRNSEGCSFLVVDVVPVGPTPCWHRGARSAASARSPVLHLAEVRLSASVTVHTACETPVGTQRKASPRSAGSFLPHP